MKKNTVLTILASGGVVASIVMAINATPKAIRILEDKNNNTDEEISIIDKGLSIWKCYIPTIVVSMATIACIVNLDIYHTNNNKYILGGYALLNTKLNNYKAAAKKVYGEDADIRIEAEVAKKSNITTGNIFRHYNDLEIDGETMLFYDSFSEKYFTTSIEAVLNAQYHTNRNLQLRGDVPFGEYCSFLGIDCPKNLDVYAWYLDDMSYDGYMWLDFYNEKVEMDDGLECILISYEFNPILDPEII